MFSNFKTRKEHEHYVKSMIGNGAIHEKYISVLASFHPKCYGAVGFTFNKPKNGFVAIFPDGRHATFSYHKCLDRWMANKNQRPPCSRCKEEVYKAFRNEILSQMRDIRFAAGFGGQGADFHVGHDWQSGNSFIRILKEFLSERNMENDILSIKIHSRRQNEHQQYNSPYLTDDELAREWKSWHYTRSRGMRMETAHDNLRAPQ